VIQGVSAGAGSVAHHLTAYGGEDEGIFHAAIVESLFLPTQPRVSELEWQLERLLAQTGCDHDNDSPMSCLRGKDLEMLQAYNVPSPFPGASLTPLPLFYWGPCIDGNLSRDYLYTMFDQGDFVDVPVLIGTDNDG
jgi:acetylcholinesterase